MNEHFADMVDQFFVFVEGPPAEIDRGETLADWLERWIEFGNAVDLSGGDFATFMQAVVLILMRVQQRPEAPEIFGPPPFFGIGGDDLPSRELWNAQVFRRKYPTMTPLVHIGTRQA